MLFSPEFKQKLRNKYRLVVMQDDTFEEKFAIRLTKLNVFVIVGVMSILLVFITTYIIAFTPLKAYIPGYAELDSQKEMRELVWKTDSLEEAMADKETYLKNIQTVLTGGIVTDSIYQMDASEEKKKEINYTKIEEDSLLRLEVENMDKFALMANEGGNTKEASSISNVFFYTPVKGYISAEFNTKGKSFGIDIVAQKDEPVKSVLDGRVIFSSWTVDAGYVIAIQHFTNIISVYKNNAVLLKKQGSFVKGGEVISIIGKSGKSSDAPNLHFELWYNGSAVNPKDYMTF